MDSEDYGSLVKSLRQKTGLTQSQVAESLGVTPGYISNVENNRTAMSLRILTYYARLVGCSLDSLVGDLEPEYAETALEKATQKFMKRFTATEKLAAENPERFNTALAMSYNNAGVFYKNQGQATKAEAFYLKAIEIYEALAMENPERYSPDLATSSAATAVFSTGMMVTPFSLARNSLHWLMACSWE